MVLGHMRPRDGTDRGPVLSPVKQGGQGIGLLWMAYEYPWVAAGIAVIVLAACIWLPVLARRVLHRLFWRTGPETQHPTIE